MKSNQLTLFAIISIATLLFVFNCQTARNVNAVTQNGALAGEWKGVAVCAGKISDCRDREVVLQMTQPDADGRLSLTVTAPTAAAEVPAVFDCQVEETMPSVLCRAGRAALDLKVAGRRLSGTLALGDDAVIRHLTARKNIDR